ncbi:MAG: aminoglycoside 6'-N-acetyltransferase [Spirochaetales bacterium]
MLKVIRANKDSKETLLSLMQMLYKNHTREDLLLELEGLFKDKNQIFFLAYSDEIPVGFCHFSLRYEYVESAKTSPVGYLEGIFVIQEYRKQHIAKALYLECEKFAKENGIKEIASDCDLDNRVSKKVHEKLGFSVANKNIHFIKTIK